MCSDRGKSPKKIKLPLIWALAISIVFSIITVYYHHHVYITAPNSVAVALNHFDVVQGEAKAPTQYRIGPYWLAHVVFTQAILLGAPNDNFTLAGVYTTVRLIVTAFAYFSLLVFLSRWFDPARTVLGLCFLVAVNPLATFMYFHQPGDPWTFLFFMLGLIAIQSGRDWWLPLLILIGTPFRETIVLLLPAYLAIRWGEIPFTRLWSLVAAMLVAFLLPYLGLRWYFGPIESYVVEHLREHQSPNLFVYNLTQPDCWMVTLLYFNVLWIAVPLVWRKLPRLIRRAWIIVPIFFIIHLIWGRLVEARLFLPILPLFIPAGLLMLGPIEPEHPQDSPE